MIDWLRKNPLFVLMVIAPTILGIIYYGLIASDIYLSESRFVIRSAQQSPQTGLSLLFQNRSADDANSVHDYILSRDAMRELDQQHPLRSAFARRGADVFVSFPGLNWDRSFERLYRYYGKHVSVDIDPISAISVLTVQAFTAQDAYDINSELLEMSERLVNRLNERSRQDLIRFADEEVKLASDKAKEASLALLDYRSKKSVFQPDQQATLQLASVSKLQDDLVSTEAQLAQLQKISPNNPQISVMNSRTEALRTAIASEASKVTSANGSLSARAPDFERLTLESTFADKQLGVALAELEAARTEARQKQIYLERVVQPGLPDKSMQPRRIRSSLTVFLLSIILWAMTRLLIASVREHAD
jgi:capsular polysaccharide transport system permease protein